MASNKTPNLGLDVWAETDYFKRAELNGNFTKIDAKVKENGDRIGDLSGDGLNILTDWLGNSHPSLKDRVKHIEIRFPFYSILDFGATLNTNDLQAVTKNTTAIQTAIQKVIENGGGTVYIPNGKWVYNSASINLTSTTTTRDIYLTLKGERGSILRSTENKPVAFKISGYDNGSFETSKVIREIAISDIKFQGNPYFNTSTDIQNSVGVEISMAQKIIFNNVLISGYKLGGLKLKQCWDSIFHHLEIYHCGHATSSTDYAYALSLTKFYDNSNANHFVSCHFEQLPLMLFADADARHNYFTNCKFEQGSAVTNPSNQSPIAISDALELGFSDCMFVKDIISIEPFITVTSAQTTYQTANKLEKSIKISNSHFVCSTGKYARWLNVNYTEIENCIFNSTDGDSSGNYPFVFGTKVSLKGKNKIIIVTDGTRTFNLTGNNNDLSDFSVDYKTSSPTAGAFLKMSSGVQNNKVYDFDVIGNPYSSFDIPFTYLDTNLVSRRKGYVNETGGSAIAYGADVQVFTHTSPTTITAMGYGYSGHTVILHAKNTTMTIQNNVNIVTKTGEDLVLTIGKVSKFTNIGGKWYEI